MQCHACPDSILGQIVLSGATGPCMAVLIAVYIEILIAQIQLLTDEKDVREPRVAEVWPTAVKQRRRR